MNQVVNVRVPLSFYVLAGRVPPTVEQARSFVTREWYGGALDGLAVQMPSVVDWPAPRLICRRSSPGSGTRTRPGRGSWRSRSRLVGWNCGANRR